jgi:hypothetical protein
MANYTYTLEFEVEVVTQGAGPLDDEGDVRVLLYTAVPDAARPFFERLALEKYRLDKREANEDFVQRKHGRFTA